MTHACIIFPFSELKQFATNEWWDSGGIEKKVTNVDMKIVALDVDGSLTDDGRKGTREQRGAVK